MGAFDADSDLMTEGKLTRRISLASGVLPEQDALTVTRTAIAAGYSDAGLMIRPDTWRQGDESQLLDLKQQHNIGFLDVEVLWIPTGARLDDGHKLIVDVGGRLGAEHVLVVSDEPNPDLLAPALQQISQWCAPYAIRPMLEFLRITSVTSLAQAKELLAAAAGHTFGILIDSLHLARSGELEKLVSLDARQHPYIQLCDGPAKCADEHAKLLEDALDLRSAPGEGELDLTKLLAALPQQTPVSMEVRSRFYREQYPDPVARAQAILQQTEKYLQGASDE